MNRRFFLKTAAGAVLAAPLLPSLREARAIGVPQPLRSVIFHSPCGCITNRWFPPVEDGPIDGSTFKGTTLEPLSAYANKLLFPRGLRAINGYGSPQLIDPHAQAMGSKLTCAPIANDTRRYALGPSLDQEIARQLNPSGTPPLVLAAGKGGGNSLVNLSYSASEIMQGANTDPGVVYQTLGGVLQGGAVELDYRRRRRQSILDGVKDDLQTLQRHDMSVADQHRLSTWLDLVRDTETSMQNMACDETRVGVDADSVAALRSGYSDAQSFTAGADMMMKLMALSMLCDTNRSFVLTFPGYVVFDWDGIHNTVDHDALAHRNGSGPSGGACYPNVIELIAQIDAWYAAKFAKLVGLLASLPEGDASVLDNTATVWLQEFSDGGAMNLNNMPICIAGSAGGALKQGVAVNVEGQPIGPGNSEADCQDGGSITFATGSTGGNVPINKLYVTLMNALGCRDSLGNPITAFGSFDGTGADAIDAGITDPGELESLKA